MINLGVFSSILTSHPTVSQETRVGSGNTGEIQYVTMRGIPLMMLLTLTDQLQVYSSQSVRRINVRLLGRIWISNLNGG